MSSDPQLPPGYPERPAPVPSAQPSHADRQFSVEDTTDTPQMRRLDPRVRIVWWLNGLFNLAVMSIPVLGIDVVFGLHPFRPGLISGAYYVVGIALVVTVPLVRYQRWRYALRPNDLWIRRGLLSISVSVIPYRRLQFVDTTAGPLDRMFGLAQLVVHTAAIGAAGRVPGLDKAEAEQLRETLAALEPDDALV